MTHCIGINTCTKFKSIPLEKNTKLCYRKTIISLNFLFQKSITQYHFFAVAKTTGNSSEKWKCMKPLKEDGQSIRSDKPSDRVMSANSDTKGKLPENHRIYAKTTVYK